MAEINHLIGIKGSLEAVYGAIGTVEGLKEWWTADTIGSSEVGATIHFRFGKIGAQDMKVTELKKNARSLSANVPAKCADLMFSVPKDQVRWIDSGDFQSDLGSFIPELKDWMDARCDKRTDVEKAMWEALKDTGANDTYRKISFRPTVEDGGGAGQVRVRGSQRAKPPNPSKNVPGTKVRT